MPLIIKGARQIGKTEAINHFAHQHYQNVVEINFVLQKEYRNIFDDGYEVVKIGTKKAAKDTVNALYPFLPFSSFLERLIQWKHIAIIRHSLHPVLYVT